jgi:hypothetical protein
VLFRWRWSNGRLSNVSMTAAKKGAEIHSILMEHYGKDAYRKTAVYYWIKKVKRRRTELTDKEAPGKPLDGDVASVIQRQHDEDPYLSSRRIAKTVGDAPPTVCRHLHQRLGLNCRHTKWVPRLLTNDHKTKPGQTAQAMLATLGQHEETGCQSLFMGDEMWIFYENRHDTV